MKGVVETGYKAVGACKTIVWSSVLSRMCVCACQYMLKAGRYNWKCGWHVFVCARYHCSVIDRFYHPVWFCVCEWRTQRVAATSDHCLMRNLVLSKSLCPNFKTFSTTVFYENESLLSLSLSLLFSRSLSGYRGQFVAGYCPNSPWFCSELVELAFIEWRKAQVMENATNWALQLRILPQFWAGTRTTQRGLAVDL